MPSSPKAPSTFCCSVFAFILPKSWQKWLQQAVDSISLLIVTACMQHQRCPQRRGQGLCRGSNVCMAWLCAGSRKDLPGEMWPWRAGLCSSMRGRCGTGTMMGSRARPSSRFPFLLFSTRGPLCILQRPSPALFRLRHLVLTGWGGPEFSPELRVHSCYFFAFPLFVPTLQKKETESQSG